MRLPIPWSVALRLGVAVTAAACAAGALALHVTHREVFSFHFTDQPYAGPHAVTLSAGSYHLSSQVAGCEGTSEWLAPTESGDPSDRVELWGSTPTHHEIDFTVTMTQLYRLDGAMITALPAGGPCQVDATITRN
jgi:hypothetical protein